MTFLCQLSTQHRGSHPKISHLLKRKHSSMRLPGALLIRKNSSYRGKRITVQMQSEEVFNVKVLCVQWTLSLVFKRKLVEFVFPQHFARMAVQVIIGVVMEWNDLSGLGRWETIDAKAAVCSRLPHVPSKHEVKPESSVALSIKPAAKPFTTTYEASKAKLARYLCVGDIE